MAKGQRAKARLGPLSPIVGLGTRAASATLRPVAGAVALSLRPVSGAAEAAVTVGRELEHRAVQRILDSPEFERLTEAALDSPRTQAALRTAMESDGAKQAVDAFFDSGLFDQVLDRLLDSPALWSMIDEIAASPAVTAAITQQSLGFMDQVQDVARSSSRKADDWLELRARRLRLRRSKRAVVKSDAGATPDPEAASEATPDGSGQSNGQPPARP